MDNSGLIGLNQKDGERRHKKLPPLVDQSPKSMIKKESGITELDLVSKMAGESGIKTTNSWQTKKERKFVPDEFDQKAIILCQFCGGQNCPQEDFRKNKIQPNAIQGLHSNWINGSILATQRPSNRLIKQYNLLQMFEKYNINSILNLQQPGQHPYCGDGIDPMIGFSYDPQLFFNRNIRFENQFWEDMTSTTFQQMMKIMNIFDRSIIQKRGKIAVHCHAGRGRTMMAIGSWLIFNDRMTVQQTIDLAVLKREGVLTKSSQRDFLRDFETELKLRWKSYFSDFENLEFKTFSEFVTWQHQALLKSERKKLHQTSYVHGTVLSILRKRIQQSCKEIIYAFIDLNDKTVFEQKWDHKHQQRLKILKLHLDQKKFQEITQNQEIRVLVALIEDFYDNIPLTPISLHAIDQLKEQLQTERRIINKEDNKRKVRKENLQKKILRRWEDILKERQAGQPQIKQQGAKQLGTIQASGEKEVKERIECMQIRENHAISQQSFGKSDVNQSGDIQINSLYLNVLTEPSIVHQVGLNSMCTFIDFVKFSLELMTCYRSQNKNQTQQHFNIIEKCLLAKFSILLQSKKKYFPLLFRGNNFRESILMKKIDKLQKYMNKNIKYMSEIFMKQLMQELQVFLKDQISIQEKFEKLILKIQKVNANVEYYSKHANSGEKFFNAKLAKQLYDSARI